MIPNYSDRVLKGQIDGHEKLLAKAVSDEEKQKLAKHLAELKAELEKRKLR